MPLQYWKEGAWRLFSVGYKKEARIVVSVAVAMAFALWY
jgi:hypothetical protein